MTATAQSLASPDGAQVDLDFEASAEGRFS
jgi:hypothetical protein